MMIICLLNLLTQAPGLCLCLCLCLCSILYRLLSMSMSMCYYLSFIVYFPTMEVFELLQKLFKNNYEVLAFFTLLSVGAPQ